MEKSDDRNFSLIKLLIFEELSQNIKSHHSFNVTFNDFVSSFCHVCNKVKVFHEIFPCTKILFLTNFVVVPEFSFPAGVFINGSFSKNNVIFLRKTYQIDNTGLLMCLYLFDETIQDFNLAFCIDAAFTNTEKSEYLKVLLFMKNVDAWSLDHCLC